MKTKTNLIRLFTAVLLIIVIQINVSSEDFDQQTSEVMYYSFVYDYPVSSFSEIDICDWMICECAFDNNEFYQCLSFDWLDVDDGPFCSLFDFDEVDGDCSFLREMLDYSLEIPVMRWMLDFEPMVMDLLLQDVKPDLLERWMFDVNSFLDFETITPQMTDWMLAEDFGIQKSQLEFEPWMIKSFGVN